MSTDQAWKFARSYKHFVFCTHCHIWLERKIENDRCPDCRRKTRKNTRSKMGQRKGIKRIEV